MNSNDINGKEVRGYMISGETALILRQYGIAIYDIATGTRITDPAYIQKDKGYGVLEDEWDAFRVSRDGIAYRSLIARLERATVSYMKAEGGDLRKAGDLERDASETEREIGAGAIDEAPEWLMAALLPVLVVRARKDPAEPESKVAEGIIAFATPKDRDAAQPYLRRARVCDEVAADYRAFYDAKIADRTKDLPLYEMSIKVAIFEAIVEGAIPDRCYDALAEEEGSLSLIYDEYIGREDTPDITDPLRAACFIETYCQRFHPDVMGLGDDEYDGDNTPD